MSAAESAKAVVIAFVEIVGIDLVVGMAVTMPQAADTIERLTGDHADRKCEAGA